MSSEGVKLPAISPPAAASAGSDRSNIGNNGTSGGGSLPLPHLIPSPDPHHGTPHTPSPAPSSPANASHPSADQASPRASVFITALPEDHDSTAQSLRRDSSQERRQRRRSVHWHAPHAAKRVGSYIRDLTYTIHLRGCSKCRKEGLIVRAPQDRSFGGGGAFVEARRQSGHYSDGSRQHSGGSRGGVGRAAGGSAGAGGGAAEIWESGHRAASGGSARGSGGGKHCSSRCVHLSGGGFAEGLVTAGGVPVGGEAARRRSRSRRKYTVVSDRYAPARVGSPDPAEVTSLSIYHKHDWEQMTWDQLLATLMTSAAKGKKERAKMNFKQFEILKKEIIAAIEEGHILKRDPRLKWENRRLLLLLQVTKLMRTRDIYKAIQEALVNHNAELRRLAQLFEVRAYRQVHAMKVDYLKSGSTLFRFTAIPGRLCRGINLYQACLAVVYGRRWSILVLQRQQRRTKEQVEAVNAEIEKVLHYKFQELPADKMRVSHLLKQLEDQMKWFEDVKRQMTGSVESMFSDLEERRQRETEVTIVEAMDACVEQQQEWADLYDFHRCLSGLCSDMAERNASLRRQIAETRHAHRHRDKADEEWHAWILQDRAPADGGDGGLRISRKKWLPV